MSSSVPRSLIPFLSILALASLVLVPSLTLAQEATGELTLYANGEDFVRQGFVSKDGWEISFDAVYVTLTGITAYQTDPAYTPDMEDELAAEVEVMLDATYTVDLAAGDEDADPILVDTVAAPEGFYNALAWQMVPAAEGDAEGYSVYISGTATRDAETVAFVLKIEREYAYTCGEFVGDERKGFLDADGEADLEMTFHFDHIFGDAELPADDGLNTGAPGFDVFAALAEDGRVEADLAALEAALSPDDFQLLIDILPTLGHVGEGHCYESGRVEHDMEAGAADE